MYGRERCRTNQRCRTNLADSSHVRQLRSSGLEAAVSEETAALLAAFLLQKQKSRHLAAAASSSAPAASSSASAPRQELFACVHSTRAPAEMTREDGSTEHEPSAAERPADTASRARCPPGFSVCVYTYVCMCVYTFVDVLHTHMHAGTGTRTHKHWTHWKHT